MAEKIKLNINESFQEIKECSISRCFIDEKTSKKDTLKCRKCQRLVHYACTRLLAYQIQLCLTYKTRSFQCQNCVKILPEILEKVEKGEESKIIKLEKEIKACENIINAQKEELIKNNFEKPGCNQTLSNMKVIENKIEKRIEGIEHKIEAILSKVNENNTKETSQKGTYAQVSTQKRNQQRKLSKTFFKRIK